MLSSLCHRGHDKTFGSGAVGIPLLSQEENCSLSHGTTAGLQYCWNTVQRQISASSLHRATFPNPSVLFPVTKRSVSW